MEPVRLKDANISILNSQVKVSALVKSLSENKTKKGDTYLDIILSDNRRSITCKYFNVDSLSISIQEGDVIEASIKVNEYNGQPSYIISGSKVLSCSPDSYILWFDKLDALKTEFNRLLGEITNPVYKLFVVMLLDKIQEQFMSVPAAKSIHHTEFGGCLAHSTLVALNSKNIATVYNSVYSDGSKFLDIELIVAGALIHDMAKTVELDWNCLSGEVDYTSDSSCLDSHITLLAEWMTIIAVENGLLGSEEYRLLKHCVLSHHGKLEWGSPVTPAIPEAYIISCCDKMDADVWGYFNSLHDVEEKQSQYCKVGGEFKRVYKK